MFKKKKKQKKGVTMVWWVCLRRMEHLAALFDAQSLHTRKCFSETLYTGENR